MVFLFLVIFVGAYALAASWVARQGTARLWLTAIGTLLLIVVSGVFLGKYYDEQSLPHLLLYFIALTGPIVVVPTVLLAYTTTAKSTTAKAFPTAILGASLGLVCGYVIVVWGLRVW